MIIPAVQSVRGIFAVLIFLSHYEMSGGPVFGMGGDLGVALFFILSGYGLALGFSSRRSFSTPKFLLSRLIKIYPLHLTCLIAAIILFHCSDLPAIAANLLLLQSWVPDAEYYFSGNGVSWFLSSLLFCYAMFPLIHRALKGYFRATLSVYAIAVVLLATCYLPALQRNLTSQEINYWSYIFPAARVLDFTLGMILYELSVRADSAIRRLAKLNEAYQWIIEPAVVALLAVGIITARYIPQCYVSALWWWLPEGALIFMLFNFPQWQGPVSRLLRTKALVWFGNQSFCFYMLHSMLISVTGRLINKFDLDVQPAGKFLLTFIVIVAASVMCEKIIVTPAKKALFRTGKASEPR